MLDALIIDNGLAYNMADLSSKFNKQKFFDKNFYPISLFYLGMDYLAEQLPHGTAQPDHAQHLHGLL